ncbi:MAG: ABC transporter ATP-binding protein [Deltaproteobacteria bacterium]|nr:ABC transporter ATP-binding protein [Deltaproteobacteria bacterium]
MTPHLAAEGIRKSFGRKPVLDGVSITVGTGEMMALLGPSGCGKSTLLRIVAGLIPKDAGAIRIAGRDMESVPARQRGVGFVFQDYALFPRMTVRENVAFGLRVRGVEALERSRKAGEILDLVGLSEEANRPVDRLSGGQRQRVALARALAMEPSLLLLDEPLSALDVKVRERLRREIKAVQKKVGITALVVTHDQEEAMELGDRIAVMNEGRIEQVAPPREVYQEPATEFVARFVGEVNVLPGQMYHGYAYSGSLAIRMAENQPLRDGSSVKVILRPEDISLHPAGTAEAGQSQADVGSVSFQGTHLRVELATEEGYPLTALLLRSHPMAGKIAEGDAVRVEALRGSVLPDPFGKKEPEYYL